MKALLLFFMTTANAEEVLKINSGLIEKIQPKQKKIELIISDNCAHCIHQVNILKECFDKKDDILVLVDNKTNLPEERLKGVLRKKKVTYDSYLLTNNLKKTYDYKGITPMMWINSQSGSESHTGVVQCDYLKLKLQTSVNNPT